MGSKEFFQSKRLFCIAFVKMLDIKGKDYTRFILKEMFEESTFVLLPDELTKENLEFTIMNLKSEEVKFK